MYRSGQVIQRLEASRLIESFPAKPGRQASYRLTSKGRFATAILNRLQPPPSADVLRAEMAQQRQKYMERMQEIALKNSGSGCDWLADSGGCGKGSSRPWAAYATRDQ
jgi:hypothetical protein